MLKTFLRSPAGMGSKSASSEITIQKMYRHVFLRKKIVVTSLRLIWEAQNFSVTSRILNLGQIVVSGLNITLECYNQGCGVDVFPGDSDSDSLESTSTPTPESTPALYGLTFAGKVILHPSTVHGEGG